MKRKIRALECMVCLMIGVVGMEVFVAAAEDSYKICWTMANLSNPVWAEKAEQAAITAEELGCEFEVVSCENDAILQVAQIENYIEQDVDAIIIGAADAIALDEVCQKALDSEIVVMCEGIELTNCTLSLLCDDYEAGRMIGEQCANFINESCGGIAEVGLLTSFENVECTLRGEAMKEALAEFCPGAVIVHEGAMTSVGEALNYVENWLQTNPNMKAIMSIGDSGSIGANQAVKAAGKADGFGIFAVDGTVEALQLMADGDPIKAELAFGSGRQIGKRSVELTYQALTEENFEKRHMHPNQLITFNNLKEIVEQWGYEAQVDLSDLE